jgi:hypothetical protein
MALHVHLFGNRCEEMHHFEETVMRMLGTYLGAEVGCGLQQGIDALVVQLERCSYRLPLPEPSLHEDADRDVLDLPTSVSAPATPAQPVNADVQPSPSKAFCDTRGAAVIKRIQVLADRLRDASVPDVTRQLIHKDIENALKRSQVRADGMSVEEAYEARPFRLPKKGLTSKHPCSSHL